MMNTATSVALCSYACSLLLTFVRAKLSDQPTLSCRYLPGDAGWPVESQWSGLNSSVGGRLIQTVPLGSPCHGSNYNEAECALLKASWVYPQI